MTICLAGRLTEPGMLQYLKLPLWLLTLNHLLTHFLWSLPRLRSQPALFTNANCTELSSSADYRAIKVAIRYMRDKK